ESKEIEVKLDRLDGLLWPGDAPKTRRRAREDREENRVGAEAERVEGEADRDRDHLRRDEAGGQMPCGALAAAIDGAGHRDRAEVEQGESDHADDAAADQGLHPLVVEPCVNGG